MYTFKACLVINFCSVCHFTRYLLFSSVCHFADPVHSPIFLFSHHYCCYYCCSCSFYFYYRYFRTFTRTADYRQWSIFVVRGKKVQQITRTGLLPAPQNKRKSCYCITRIRTHKLGAINIPCCCLQSERSITFSAKNWLLTMQP